MKFCWHKYMYEPVENFLVIYVRRHCSKCKKLWRWEGYWCLMGGLRTDKDLTPVLTKGDDK